MSGDTTLPESEIAREKRFVTRLIEDGLIEPHTTPRSFHDQLTNLKGKWEISWPLSLDDVIRLFMKGIETNAVIQRLCEKHERAGYIKAGWVTLMGFIEAGNWENARTAMLRIPVVLTEHTTPGRLLHRLIQLRLSGVERF